MKIIILSLALISVLNWAYAQPGSINNIQVSQGVGVNERVLDIQFDLTGSYAAYDISLEVSLDNGDSYAPIDPNEVTGDESSVAPGAGIQLVWDGRISYAGQSTEMARIKIIANSVWQCGDPITDSRNGQVYNTVLIGTQCWMQEDLNYETGNSWCYENDPLYCGTYGRLYDWGTIMNGAASSNSVPSGVQGICPTGWHVPGDAEWDIMFNYLGGADIAGGKMKEAGFDHWNFPNEGATNESGFTALPGGYYNPDGSFSSISGLGVWWTSTESSDTHAWYLYIIGNQEYVTRNSYEKTFGFSLRCLKD